MGDAEPAGAAQRFEPAGSATHRTLRHVLRLIARGELAPGQRLPPERDLSLRWGMSRSSIREAFSALVTLGVLESRQGAGVFVTALTPDRLVGGLRLALEVVDERHLAELSQVQSALHATAAGLAAARHGSHGRHRLRELAAACRAATTAATAAEGDRRFHAEVCRLSGNAMLAAVADAAMPHHGRELVWRRGKNQDALHDDHDALVAAIEAGDPEAARALAAAHVFRTVDALRAGGPALRDEPVAVTEPAGAAELGHRPTPDWYRDAKLGIIVHWGLYAVPGWAPRDDALVELMTDEEPGPRAADEPDPLVRHPFAEWYQNGMAIEGSPTWHHHRAAHGGRPYADFRTGFEAALRRWDPSTWAELFAAAGARYVVQVAKHHDGYLLWPSGRPNPRVTDWSTSRDVVGGVADAVRAKGMRLGLYYSSGIDWTFANLPIRRMLDAKRSMPPGPVYARYVDAHWRELIDRYRPSILWNDMGYPPQADVHALFRDFYERVPDGVVNDRFWAGTFDVSTPNYFRPETIDPQPWECVRPIGLSFGWNRQEREPDVLTGAQLVHLLVDVVSKNGTLLLGVSPDERGDVPGPQRRSLLQLGEWLDRNGRAVYGTRPWVAAESSTQDGVPVRFTASAGELFVILLGRPAADCAVTGLHLGADAVVSELGSAAPLDVRPGRRGSIIRLPAAAGAAHTRVLNIAHPPSRLDI